MVRLADDNVVTRGSRIAQTILDEKLPLVVEVIPGTAGEGQGLLRAYDFGSYDLSRASAARLIQDAMAAAESVSDARIIERLAREGSQHVYVGRRAVRPGADGLLDHAEIRTEEGKKFVYIQLRTIKPQEGGNADTDDERSSSALAGARASSLQS